jgi:hypothetical protein
VQVPTVAEKSFADARLRPANVLALAWLASNLGAVLFYAGAADPNIDPVCSASPWSALSWIFAVLACGGLLLAVAGVVTATKHRRLRASALWILALLVSMTQVVFAVMAAHMAMGQCGLQLL